MSPTMLPGYICSRCRGGDLNLNYIHVKGDAEYESHMLDRDPTWGSTGFFCRPIRDRILQHALYGPRSSGTWNRLKTLLPDEEWE